MPETAKRTARVPILGEDGRISDDYVPAAIGEGVESAEAAAAAAESAKTAAETARDAAVTAKDGAESAKTAAESAEVGAESAKDAAESAKMSAGGSASQAATSAQQAADSAQKAADKAASVLDHYIESATATTLEPGSEATASVADQVLALGIPRGDKGDKGDKGDPGDVSAVQTAEGSDLSVSTDEGTVTIDDSALRARIEDLENASRNVVTGTSTDLVSHGEDAYAQKPREVRIKGKTWVNRWPVIEDTNLGVTVSTDGTGLITISGTATGNASLGGINVPLAAGNKYMVLVSNTAANVRLFVNRYIGGEVQSPRLIDIDLTTTTTTTTTVNSGETFRAFFYVANGQTVNASFRVMLVEGTEAPDCFTPTESITSVQPENLVTSGKNLVDPSRQENGGYTYQDDGTINAVPSDARLWGYANSNIFMSLPAGSYALSLQTAGVDGANNAVIIYDADGTTLSGVYMPEINSGDRIARTLTLSHQSEIGVFWKLIGNGTATIQLELGSTATAYEPPNVTTTPIDLDGNTLCSLPDGTHDELTIDATGAVTLVKRTQMVQLDGDADWVRLPASNKVQNGLYSADINGGTAYVREPTFASDAAGVKTWMGTNTPIVIMPLLEPQIISLPPVTLPALPAPTFNQYHDADVPSDTSTEYARDINIVLANLESVQAALLGGE